MVGVGARVVRNVSGTGEEGAVVAGAGGGVRRADLAGQARTGTMVAWAVGPTPVAPLFLALSPADATTIIMIERMPEGLSPLSSRRQPKPQRLWP